MRTGGGSRTHIYKPCDQCSTVELRLLHFTKPFKHYGRAFHNAAQIVSSLFTYQRYDYFPNAQIFLMIFTHFFALAPIFAKNALLEARNGTNCDLR